MQTFAPDPRRLAAKARRGLGPPWPTSNASNLKGSVIAGSFDAAKRSPGMINVVREGRGRPLLLVHGLAGVGGRGTPSLLPSQAIAR